VAAVIGLPIVVGVLVGLLRLVGALGSGGGGDEPPSAGARAGIGLPVAIYVGWLVAFGYAYANGLAMWDWLILGVGVAGFVVAEVVLVVLGGWRPGFALLTGLSIGVVLGLPLAFLSALAVGLRVGAAIGVTAGLIAWPALMGADFAARGVDLETLKARFYPSKTIETTKETIEWARARMPLSRKS
jgi:hypothetical protein